MKIDIVSDIVCPWCIVGHQQLARALAKTQVSAQIHWQPFELNPSMPAEGQNLLEHLSQKYGSTKVQNEQNRQKLIDLGNTLDFEFAFSDDSRMVNTFKAHQLLHWAGLQDTRKGHELNLALFQANFTDQVDISDNNVLLAAAISVGFDSESTITVLQDEPYATDVRQRQKHWLDNGISGVPAMVFDDKYLVTGAQGIDNYVSVIHQVLEQENKT